MRKLLLALLIAAPSVASAQAEVMFTDFLANASGFTVNLLFRNTDTYASPTIRTLQDFTVGASQKIAAFCAPADVFCDITRTTTLSTVGNVDRSVIPTTALSWKPLATWSESSCGGLDCLNRINMLGSGAGVFGCKVPDAGIEYAGRTCAGDGFDGWLRYGYSFHWSSSRSLEVPTWSANDLMASFDTRTWPYASVTTAPEPTSVALVAVGVVAIGLSARRRRESR